MAKTQVSTDDATAPQPTARTAVRETILTTVSDGLCADAVRGVEWAAVDDTVQAVHSGGIVNDVAGRFVAGTLPDFDEYGFDLEGEVAL